MPTLNWIGKDKIISHHLDVPFKVLNHEYGFDKKETTETPNNSGNLIIHGDNLEALKSLLPKYEGKVNCIYIDPPYNTGNESWVYNDNVNAPKIKKWLGKVVGKESEDLTRHDKWLCMMYPRLKLLHKLLANDGAIFISIDDNEQASLKLMMDEIFGGGNFIATIPTIMNLKGNQDQFAFAGTHEYTVIYSKNKKIITFGNLLLDEEDADIWEIDEIGYFKKGANIKATGVDAAREKRPNMFYPIFLNENFEISEFQNEEYYHELLPLTDGKEMRWRWSKGKIFNEIHNLIIQKGKDGFSIYKKQRPDLGDLPSKKPKSIFYKPEYSSGNGTNQMKSIFGNKLFDTPKPLELIYDFFQISTNKNSIILDSFAGSGTTAHAVLNLNQQDGGNRKFILIEMEDYAQTITAERVKRVIKGYGEGSKAVAGTGGSFDYYTLGEPLFDDNNNLNENVSIEKIREYVWFTETRSSYSPPVIARDEAISNSKVFLGNHNDTNYYFIYDKNHLTTLDYDSLTQYVQQKAERYVIYADNCLLPEPFMREKNIDFKKIPRDITRF